MYWLSSYLIVELILSDSFFFVELTASAFLTFHFRDLNLPEDPFSRVGKHGIDLITKEWVNKFSKAQVFMQTDPHRSI